MKRKIYNDLLKWKNEEQGAVALLVEGARRVGKSYIVEEFAQKVSCQHVIVAFGDYSEAVKDFCRMMDIELI